jgi:hypothetical protein
MTDESPFASFVPSETTPPEKKIRKKREKKVAAPETEQPVKERKKREKRTEPVLPISVLLSIGTLGADELAVISKIARDLQALPKKSRANVVQALTKVFPAG